MSEPLESLCINNASMCTVQSEFLVMDRLAAAQYCDGAIEVGARFALEVACCADDFVAFRLVRIA